MRFWLRFGGHDVELPIGKTVIGRSDRCQLIVEDPLVSRRHAVLVVDRVSATIEDLGSFNGVLLNGERLVGSAKLNKGDRIAVGRQEFELFMADDDHSSPPDQRKSLKVRTLSKYEVRTQDIVKDDAESTDRGDALEMLGGVADKALALGRGKEAERILEKPLKAVLATVKSGIAIDSEKAERAAEFAVRLAVASGESSWVEYVFTLYDARKLVLPAKVIDSLYAAIRDLPGISLAPLRSYVTTLRALEPSLGPADRFLVRRVEGLQGVASSV